MIYRDTRCVYCACVCVGERDIGIACTYMYTCMNGIERFMVCILCVCYRRSLNIRSCMNIRICMYVCMHHYKKIPHVHTVCVCVKTNVYIHVCVYMYPYYIIYKNTWLAYCAYLLGGDPKIDKSISRNSARSPVSCLTCK